MTLLMNDMTEQLWSIQPEQTSFDKFIMPWIVVRLLLILQNEMDYGEDPSMSPRLQQYPQTAVHFPSAGMQTSSGIFGHASVGLAPRPSYSDQAKNTVFSNALSSPVCRSLQHYHLSQGGSRNHDTTSPSVNRESNSPSNNDSSMDMHSDSPAHESYWWIAKNSSLLPKASWALCPWLSCWFV